MPVFERDGLTFHSLDERDTSGRPFAFQHGLGGDVSQPADVFSPPPGTRLLSLNCRGHWETRPLGPVDKLSFSSFADDVAALMHHFGLRRAAVGGISMGAGVALNLASRYPKRVAGLVLSRPAWLDSPRPKNLKAYPVIARLLGEHGAKLGRELFESIKPGATSENFCSTTFMNKGERKGRGYSRPRPFGYSLSRYQPPPVILVISVPL
jgi:pimeloyl-ACP methyl ester carboxylesterase